MAAAPAPAASTVPPGPATSTQVRNHHRRRPHPPAAEGGAAVAPDTIDDVSGWWWTDSAAARVADGMLYNNEDSVGDNDERYSRDDVYTSALAAAPMPGVPSGTEVLHARPYTHQPYSHISLYDRMLHLPHPRVPTAATVGNLETNIPTPSFAGVRNHLHRPPLPSRFHQLQHLELHLPPPTLTLPPRTMDATSLAAAVPSSSSLSSPLLSSPSSFLDALQRQPLLLPPDSDAAAAAAAVVAATRAFNATVIASASSPSATAASSPHHVLHAHLSTRQPSHAAPYHSSLTTGADATISKRPTPPQRRRQQRPPAPPQPQLPPPPQQAASPAWHKPTASNSNMYQPVARLPQRFLLAAAAAAASCVVDADAPARNGDGNHIEDGDAAPIPAPEVSQKSPQSAARAGASARAPRRQVSARAPTSLLSSAAGTVYAIRATSPPPQTRHQNRRRHPPVHSRAPMLVLPDLAVQPATPTAATASTESSVSAALATATDSAAVASLPPPPQQQRDLPSVEQTPNRFLESCSLLLDQELNPFDHCFAEAAEAAEATSPAGDTASIHEPAPRASASPQEPQPAPDMPLVDGRVSEASAVTVESSSMSASPSVVPPPPSGRAASAAATAMPSPRPDSPSDAAAATSSPPSFQQPPCVPNNRKRSRASSAASAVVDSADEPMSPHSAQGAVSAGGHALSRGRSATTSAASTPKPEPADSKSTLLHEVTPATLAPATKRRRTASSRSAAPQPIPAAAHDLVVTPPRGRKSVKSQPRQAAATSTATAEVATAAPARRRRAATADSTPSIGDGAADDDENENDTEVDGVQGGDDDDGDEEFRPRSAGR
ncbi:hypothetical protein HK405_005705, partial [Cladochytrium tenue]